jgi:hypothetical protein
MRAMDRRRFVPSSESLEGRAMLTTTATGNALNIFGGSTTTQNLPITFQQKEMRIEKMPLNLRALEPDRFLPADTIHQIQLGLNQIMSEAAPAPPKALTNYNLALRKIVFNSSLSTHAADLLIHGFAGSLKSAHTPNPGLTTLTTAVSHLVTQVDTASINPVFLATNDTSYLLQLALVIGQPMPAPRVPSIAKTSGTRINTELSVTPLSNPTLVGSYVYQTTIQLINPATNAIYGQAAVAKNGQYSLRVATPLGLGKHQFVVRAVDEVGHLSHVSRVFTIKVVPPKHNKTVTTGQATPQGPLASLPALQSSIH